MAKQKTDKKADVKTDAPAEKKAKKTSPALFFKQVKAEGKKITWPSRHETTVSTVAVFIMVTIAAVFLYVADQVLALGVRTIMGF